MEDKKSIMLDYYIYLISKKLEKNALEIKLREGWDFI